MSEYMKMLDRRFWTLRTSFSVVMGPWKTELNGLCEIIHIAQYGESVKSFVGVVCGIIHIALHGGSV